MAAASRLTARDLPLDLTCPKVRSHRPTPYKLYAGFSSQFAEQLLRVLCRKRDSRVFDPWVGSGTTIRSARDLGHPATGVDINPAMIVIAKARLLTQEDRSMTSDIVRRMLRPNPDVIPYDDDPLHQWFTPRAAALIRSVELVARKSHAQLSPTDIEQLSNAQAAAYTVLFIAVRKLLASEVGTNPTWIRVHADHEPKLQLRWPTLRSLLLTGAESVLNDLPPAPRDGSASPSFRVQSSTQLTPENLTADVVLTSPPYCTRIDYAVATRPELAVLGLSLRDQDSLRRQSLGTTTVPKEEPWLPATPSKTLIQLLARVRNHDSKASKTYYSKWLGQYFTEYTKALRAITSVIATNGALALVVQDSHYKNVRIDLHAITTEVLAGWGWELLRAYPYQIPVTKAAMNTRSRMYRAGSSATETVSVYTRFAPETRQ